MIPIAKPFIGKEEKEAVLSVLGSGMLAQGKVVREFEQKFAEFIGVKHAIATSSGTTALHAALLAHNIKEGDEVITTPFTFIATANAIRMAGANPIFVDIEEETFNINSDLIESAITEKTKAIMPVHLFGLPAEMEKIQRVAKKYNLSVIEDSCQAHGATIDDRKVGSFETGCFSFYPTKNMTSGEGGMITTNDDKIAEKARMVINHGSKEKYFHNLHGYNYRMTNLSAAIGLEQLKKLPPFNNRRKEIALYYNKELQNLKGIKIPIDKEGHVYHQYTLVVENRDEFQLKMKDNGVETIVHYPIPVHKQEAYANFANQIFQNAEKLASKVVSIPVSPNLTDNQCQQVVNSIKKSIVYGGNLKDE